MKYAKFMLKLIFLMTIPNNIHSNLKLDFATCSFPETHIRK